jgi:hypothetical protein
MEQVKQTSVEWLVDEFKALGIYSSTLKEKCEQAKEMEKEQIIDFTRNAVRKILDEDRQNPFNLEQYYEQTYGGKDGK